MATPFSRHVRQAVANVPPPDVSVTAIRSDEVVGACHREEIANPVTSSTSPLEQARYPSIAGDSHTWSGRNQDSPGERQHRISETQTENVKSNRPSVHFKVSLGRDATYFAVNEAGGFPCPYGGDLTGRDLESCPNREPGSSTRRQVRGAIRLRGLPHGRRTCNPLRYLLLRSSMHARPNNQKEEHEMFIFHPFVDLFALFGLVHLGRMLMKRRHKSAS
jgi:hypothetical protein